MRGLCLVLILADFMLIQAQAGDLPLGPNVFNGGKFHFGANPVLRRRIFYKFQNILLYYVGPLSDYNIYRT